MNRNFIFATILVTILVIAGGIFAVTRPPKVQSRSELLRSSTSVLGVKEAKVVLVEFSDFQCPACKAFKSSVDDILLTYGDRLVFGYRHYPLPQHPYAKNLALASEAAAEQGKFWEMYDYIFSRQETLNENSYLDGARTLGLDMQRFEQDMSSSEVKNRVDMDIADGFRFRVNSTPTFFLNGKKLSLRTPNDLKLAVQKEFEANE